MFVGGIVVGLELISTVEAADPGQHLSLNQPVVYAALFLIFTGVYVFAGAISDVKWLWLPYKKIHRLNRLIGEMAEDLSQLAVVVLVLARRQGGDLSKKNDSTLNEVQDWSDRLEGFVSKMWGTSYMAMLGSTFDASLGVRDGYLIPELRRLDMLIDVAPSLKMRITSDFSTDIIYEIIDLMESFGAHKDGVERAKQTLQRLEEVKTLPHDESISVASAVRRYG